MWDKVCAQTKQPAPEKGAPEGPGSLLGSPLFMIVAFVAIMYFFLLRPSQKREKERQQMLGSLAKNDQVVTTGGIYGTIVGLKDKTVVLRVNDDQNVKMEFLRGSISQVTSPADEDQEESEST